MDFEFTEEQKMIQETTREFAQREVAPGARDNNRNQHFPSELIQKLGEIGLLGLTVSPDYGGGGADYLSYCLFLEELGKVDVGVALTASAHLSLACKTIMRWGSDDQKQRYLPRLASGQALGAFATTEANVGSDVASIETSARMDGNDWVLDGTKTWISNGGVAEVIVVIAQTDRSKGHRGLAAFLVERDMPGFSSTDLHNKMGVRSSNTAELVFSSCRVPQDNVLGPVGKGMSVALSAFDDARLGVAARSIGAAQACIDASVAYAQTRKQFGALIGTRQLVQERIADMCVQTEAARLLVYRAATLKNQGQAATAETSMAKYYASEIAFQVANSAIQIHGSYAYTDDCPVERMLRDVRVSCILEGTSEMQKLILGRYKTGLNAIA
jgi:alkylation response protein AidB-like acyl-CoA dehydrogenase